MSESQIKQMTTDDVPKMLRREMNGSFDYLPGATQRGLVETRTKSLTEQGLLAPANGEQPEPQHRERTRHDIPMQPPSPGASEKDLRDALRTARKRYKECIQAVAELRVLAERAAENEQTAEAESKTFDGLDEMVTRHEVEALRSGNDNRLPYTLQRRLTDRSVARDRVERAGAACARVQIEVDQANQKLYAARTRLEHAAYAIAICLARQFIHALAEVEQEAMHYRHIIASLQLPGASVPSDLANAAFQPMPIVAHDPVYTKTWQTFIQSLIADADAALPDMDK